MNSLQKLVLLLVVVETCVIYYMWNKLKRYERTVNISLEESEILQPEEESSEVPKFRASPLPPPRVGAWNRSQGTVRLKSDTFEKQDHTKISESCLPTESRPGYDYDNFLSLKRF
jgi:hypothetical protein